VSKENCPICNQLRSLEKHHSDVGLVRICADCHTQIHANRIDVVGENEEIKFLVRKEYPVKIFSVADMNIEIDWTHRYIRIRYDGKKIFKQFRRMKLRQALEDILRAINKDNYVEDVLKRCGLPPDAY